MVPLLLRFGHSLGYWLGLVILALLLLAVGLYYQHGLNYWPCLACIHTRIWVVGLALVALYGLAVRRYRWPLLSAQLGIAAIGGGMLERAWYLFGTERGFITAGCGVDLSLPAWLPLDRWWPWLFEAWTSCDQTPVLMLGITMAEALLVLASLLLLLSLSLAAVTALGRRYWWLLR